MDLDAKSYLAYAFCAAQYSLGEQRNVLPNEKPEIKKISTWVIEHIKKIFNRKNYSIAMAGYDKNISNLNISKNTPLFNMGDTYFDVYYPGGICFIYNNDIESPNTLFITNNNNSLRMMSDRMHPSSFNSIKNEIIDAEKNFE